MEARTDFADHFRNIQQKFSRYYAQVLTEAKLTLPQFALLSLFSDLDSMSMSEAAEKLHLTKAAITNLVDRLEESKCLRRVSHPTDRRIYLLEIQSRGKKIIQKIQNQKLTFLLKVLNAFKAEEREVIIRFYSRLSSQMNELLSEAEGGGR